MPLDTSITKSLPKPIVAIVIALKGLYIFGIIINIMSIKNSLILLFFNNDSLSLIPTIIIFSERSISLLVLAVYILYLISVDDISRLHWVMSNFFKTSSKVKPLYFP